MILPTHSGVVTTFYIGRCRTVFLGKKEQTIRVPPVSRGEGDRFENECFVFHTETKKNHTKDEGQEKTKTSHSTRFVFATVSTLGEALSLSLCKNQLPSLHAAYRTNHNKRALMCGLLYSQQPYRFCETSVAEGLVVGRASGAGVPQDSEDSAESVGRIGRHLGRRRVEGRV